MSVLTVTFPNPWTLHPIVSCRSPLNRLHENIKKVFTDRINPTYPLRDLSERLIVILFAVITYVVHILLSIPYWLNNQISFQVTNQLHVHTSKNSELELSSEAVREITDVSKLTEQDSIYSGDLSREKEKITQKIQDGQFAELMSYIRTSEGTNRTDALSALFVILGIKPIRVYEGNTQVDAKLLSILKQIQDPKIRFSQDKMHRYFINRDPLACFDPFKYIQLDPASQLSSIISDIFPSRGSMDVDQLLSYLLGFGPSWEAYAVNETYGTEGRRWSCCFIPFHYREIGTVLFRQFFQREPSSIQAEALGRAYHCQFASIHERSQYINISKIRAQTDPVSKLLAVTGTDFFFDGITARTDYFRKGYTLKKWVMQTYFSSIALV